MDSPWPVVGRDVGVLSNSVASSSEVGAVVVGTATVLLVVEGAIPAATVVDVVLELVVVAEFAVQMA